MGRIYMENDAFISNLCKDLKSAENANFLEYKTMMIFASFKKIESTRSHCFMNFCEVLSSEREVIK